MGKNKKGGKKNNDIFVSVCTPTYNRRPFINSMIKCFDHQTYPKDKIEWIIIDDGTDKIEDLVKDHPNVKYYSYDEKMPLGKKRNLMHEKSKGDILVYMDDDDYYPPCRIQHAVDMLQQHPKALCAGSSEIYIYFKHINQMVQFGPYGPNHATAGTFAFKRELLKEHKYNDTAALAEEKAFLKDYTVPFVQLEPKKTILVFSHIHNTFDKKTLLDNRHPQFVKDSDKTVDDFVKESDLKDFYMNQIENLLKDYEPGRPEMKPDVLKQIKELKQEREKQAREMQQNQQNGIPPQMIEMMKQNPKMLKEILKKQNNITDEQFEMLKQQIEMQDKIGGAGMQNQQQGEGQIVVENNGQQKVLNNNEILQLLQQQQQTIQMLQSKVNDMQEKDKTILELQTKISELTEKIAELS
tara:strand:+ start:22 stop:1251 length:1230 start_codon:yes stop_codon:yes gene_type:complete